MYIHKILISYEQRWENGRAILPPLSISSVRIDSPKYPMENR